MHYSLKSKELPLEPFIVYLFSPVSLNHWTHRGVILLCIDYTKRMIL